MNQLSYSIICFVSIFAKFGFSGNPCYLPLNRYSCSECITLSPECAWCISSNYAFSDERCRPLSELTDSNSNAFCESEDIHNPLRKPKVNLVDGNDKVVSPQKVVIYTKKNQEATFDLRFTKPADYKMDLYYLMDATQSMKKHFNKLLSLKNVMESTLRDLSSDFRMGFGTFADKGVLPFSDKSGLTHCHKRCDPEYIFKSHMSLSDNLEQLEALADMKLSQSVDSPEALLDAMVQSLVCGSKIGWRSDAFKMLLVTTDALFHTAGDGKLAGLFQPNDLECHLGKEIDGNAMIYRDSDMDYVAVPQLLQVLAKHDTSVILAITGNWSDIYEGLTDLVDQSGTNIYLAKLTADSSNIVDVIKDAYKKLTRSVQLTDTAPKDDISLSFGAKCEDEFEVNRRSCDVIAGKEYTFKVGVTPLSCKNQTFSISPKGYLGLEVEVVVTCDCSCEREVQTTQDVCSDEGEVICGACKCKPGFAGPSCNCIIDSFGDHKDTCIDPDDTNELVCNGHGRCLCGQCSCEEGYNGQFCACSDFGCPSNYGVQCSGKGKCSCGDCECEPGFKGAACECDERTRGCNPQNPLFPDTLEDVRKKYKTTACFGRGECTCGRCDCEKPFTGEQCRICSGSECPNYCDDLISCIKCKVHGPKSGIEDCESVCPKYQYQVYPVEEIPNFDTDAYDWVFYEAEACTAIDTEECKFRFSYIKVESGGKEPNIIIYAKEEKVFLLGLLLLALYKFFLMYQDYLEYKQFEMNTKDPDFWNAGVETNPLYVSPKSEFANPMHGHEQ